MGAIYGGGKVVDVNYAKDEVIIALSVNGETSIFVTENYTTTLAAIDVFNASEEGGHNDWMLPNLFDAKRCVPNLTGSDAGAEMWTSDAYNATDNKTVHYIDEKIVVGHVAKTDAIFFFVVRKQVVTA